MLYAFTGLDAAFLLSNPFNNWALDYQQITVCNDVYFRYIPDTWYNIHLAFSYLLVTAILVILAVKSAKVPFVYAGRYLNVLLVILTVVFLNFVFIFTSNVIDFSCMLYAFAAYAIYKISFDYSPSLMKFQSRRMLVDKIQDPVLLFDMEERLVDFNAEATVKLGVTKGDLYNLTRERFETEYLKHPYTKGGISLSFEVTLCKSYADIIYYTSLVCIREKNGRRIGDLYVLHDITEQKLMYRALEKVSMYDSLTGFYSHHSFSKLLKEMDRHNQRPILIVVCNISGLKLINSVCGRKHGDKIILSLAEAVKTNFPNGTLMGHLEDDMSMLALYDMEKEEAEERMERVVEALSQDKALGFPVSINYGIARKESGTVPIMDYIKYAENDLLLKKIRNEAAQKSEMLDSMMRIFYGEGYESTDHVERTLEYTMALGKKLGLAPQQLKRLELLVRYHDIGKLMMEKEILRKEGSLSPSEWELMRAHPVKGYCIARDSDIITEIAHLILVHQECYDGTGYPNGLKGEEIPLLARIFYIADSYDIMTNPRSYRTEKAPEEAVAELRKNAGTQFDPELIAPFIECLKEMNILSEIA